MKISILRKEAKLSTAITEWIKGDHTQRQIILMISLIVGVIFSITFIYSDYLT